MLTGHTDVRIQDCRRVTARTFRCVTNVDVFETEDDVTSASRITLRRDGVLLYADRLDGHEDRSLFEPMPYLWSPTQSHPTWNVV
jgi:hypothetical protein